MKGWIEEFGEEMRMGKMTGIEEAGHHTFIHIWNEITSHPAFTPQPQIITALWPVLISRPA